MIYLSALHHQIKSSYKVSELGVIECRGDVPKILYLLGWSKVGFVRVVIEIVLMDPGAICLLPFSPKMIEVSLTHLVEYLNMRGFRSCQSREMSTHCTNDILLAFGGPLKLINILRVLQYLATRSCHFLALVSEL